MTYVTLIILLANWQGGAAISTSAQFATMEACQIAANEINTKAKAAMSGISATPYALCTARDSR